jgi:hypothetical protein
MTYLLASFMLYTVVGYVALWRSRDAVYSVTVAGVAAVGDVARLLSVPWSLTPGGYAGAWSWGVPAFFSPVVVGWYFTYALVPFAIAMGPRLSARAVMCWLVVSLLGGLGSGLLSVAPPWLAGAAPRAASALAWSRWVVAGDIQPAASFPSLHVAVPLAVAVAQCSRWWFAYAAITAAVVVVAGEHWAMDVVGAVVLVVVVEVSRERVALAWERYWRGRRAWYEGERAGVSRSAGEWEDVHDERDGGGVAEGQSGAAYLLDV